MGDQKIPFYHNKPIMVLWWEADVFVMFLVALTLTMAISYLFLPLIVYGPMGFNRLKQENPRGYSTHLFYFIGQLKLKGYPGYFEQEFIG